MMKNQIRIAFLVSVVSFFAPNSPSQAMNDEEKSSSSTTVKSQPPVSNSGGCVWNIPCTSSEIADAKAELERIADRNAGPGNTHLDNAIRRSHIND